MTKKIFLLFSLITFTACYSTSEPFLAEDIRYLRNTVFIEELRIPNEDSLPSFLVSFVKNVKNNQLLETFGTNYFGLESDQYDEIFQENELFSNTVQTILEKYAVRLPIDPNHTEPWKQHLVAHYITLKFLEICREKSQGNYVKGD